MSTKTASAAKIAPLQRVTGQTVTDRTEQKELDEQRRRVFPVSISSQACARLLEQFLRQDQEERTKLLTRLSEMMPQTNQAVLFEFALQQLSHEQITQLERDVSTGLPPPSKEQAGV